MIASRLWHCFAKDRDGSFAIETALILPVLITLTFGTFEVGSMVARQHQLQSAASETTTIALAASRGAAIEIDTLRDILATSTKLPAGNVVITRFYRCGDSATTVTDPNVCTAKSGVTTSGGTPSPAVMSSYLKIVLTDDYIPVWKRIGVGDTVRFQVERTVMLS